MPQVKLTGPMEEILRMAQTGTTRFNPYNSSVQAVKRRGLLKQDYGSWNGRNCLFRLTDDGRAYVLPGDDR